MNRLRRFGPSTRLFLAALLALCIGVRLLTPAGFMPSFAGGSLTIVSCPDADGAPPKPTMPEMAGMDMSAMDMAGMAMPDAGQHDGHSGFHQTCPYAPAASLAGLDAGIAFVILAVLLTALSPLAPPLARFRRHAARERPPSQGPPLPA